MSHPAIASCSKKCTNNKSDTIPQTTKRVPKPARPRNERPFTYSSSDDYGGNQSDSSTSNSSLVSSPRYMERHPRVLESVRKKSSGRLSNERGSASQRGSFAVLGSRTSLPPLDENTTLDATESQLSLNLRRATRSSSWTNQKILDAIDGLHTCAHEIDPCLALLGVKVKVPKSREELNQNETSNPCSFEKFVVPRSISNLIMKSRSSGSVNPIQIPGQNRDRDNSCYNFLSGIREVDDEEQLQQDDATTQINISLAGSPVANNGKCNNNSSASPTTLGGSSGIKLKITTPASETQIHGVSSENEIKREC